MAIVPNTITLPENRLDLEALIEAAIARLDDVDGDTDQEPDSDGEPSLGSLDRVSQVRWSAGDSSDAEDEHDGREPCCEDEGAPCDDEGAQCEDEGSHDLASGLPFFIGDCSPIRLVRS